MLMQSAKAICTCYKIENITTFVKVVIPMKKSVVAKSKVTCTMQHILYMGSRSSDKQQF